MIYSFFDPQFYISFFVFLISIFISFLIPGYLIISKTKFSSRATKLLLSNVLGLVLWGLQGYVFGYLHARWLTYVYLGLCFPMFIISVKKIRSFSFKLSVSKITAVLMTIGILLHILAVFSSGMRYKDGVKFFGNNGFDGVVKFFFGKQI